MYQKELSSYKSLYFWSWVITHASYDIYVLHDIDLYILYLGQRLIVTFYAQWRMWEAVVQFSLTRRQKANGKER